MKEHRELIKDFFIAVAVYVALIAGLTFMLADDAEATTDGYAVLMEDFFEVTPPCDNCFRFFETTNRVWTGQVDVLFNPLDSEVHGAGNVERAITRAIDLVQLYVSIDLVYQGRTTTAKPTSYDPSYQNTILFNVEDMAYPQIGYAYVWWDWTEAGRLNQGVASFSTLASRDCLNGVALHELLHTLYIDHSDVQDSIMANSPYRTCEYQSTLRYDDIVALQALYPAQPNRQGVITSFDGAEACTYQPEVTFDGAKAQGLTLCGTVTHAEAEKVEL